MKDDVAKNKWFQQTNKEITHLHKNNDQNSYGNDDASVSIDSDVRVSSTSSVRSEAKIELSGLQFFFAQPKIEVREDEHGDGVILLDNGSKPNIFKNKLMVNNTRNLRYNMELATNAGTRIIEEEADVSGF